MGPRSVFDAIEIFDPEGVGRLGVYGWEDGNPPLEGFWTTDQIEQAFPI